MRRHGSSTTVIELVGLPGSGKSTVIDTLSHVAEVEVIGPLRRARHLPWLALGAIEAAPAVVRAAQDAAVSRQQLKWMARLPALAQIATRARNHQAQKRIVVIDQGPVYTLARLCGSSSHTIVSWRNRQVVGWSARLDVIVMLDAPDDTLLTRIESREKTHALKHASADAAKSALEAQRSDLRAVVQQLADRDVAVVCVSSATAGAGAVAQSVLDEIAAMLDQVRAGEGRPL